MNIEIQKTDQDPQPKFSLPTEKYLEFITNALTSEKVSSLTPEIVAVGKEELEKGARPIHALVMFFEIAKKSNDETKAAQKELEKHIKSQAKSQAPAQVITLDITTMPAAAQEAPTVGAKQNAPEIQPSIPVEVGDTFKSDTTEYTVRGFAPGGGIQFKNTQGGKGVWNIAKFNEYISNGQLVKQEAVAAPETLAAPLERKTTNLPEVTLSLPTGDFVMKKGTQILKQDNEALHKLITSKVKKDLKGEVEKYEIKGTFKNEKNVVLVDIIPTYIGGVVGKPITRGQEWLESVPKPRQTTEKIEADHVQIDGVTINVGDTLPKNILDMVNAGQKDGQPQSDTWTVDRVFYQTYPIVKENGKKGTGGGMRMGLTAPDGTKTSVSLVELRKTLRQKKDEVTRTQRAEQKAAKAVTTPVAAPKPAEITPDVTPAPEATKTPETFDQQAETARLQELATELFSESNKQKQVELLLAVFPEYETLVKQFGPETLLRETMKQLGIEIPQISAAQTINTAPAAVEISQAPEEIVETQTSPETFSTFIQFKHGGAGAEDFLNIGTTITSDTYPAAHAIFTAALAEQGIPASSSITLNKVSVRNEMVDKKKVTVRTAYVTLDDGKEYTLLQKDLYLAEKVSQPVKAIPSPETGPSAPIALDAELAQEVASLVEETAQEELVEPQNSQETTQEEPAEEVPTPDATAQSFEAPTPAPEEIVETQTSPEQEPVAEFSVSQVKEAIQDAMQTLDAQNDIESSNFELRRSGHVGLVCTFKQQEKTGGFLGLGKQKWTISANIDIKGGVFELIEDNIKFNSQDHDAIEKSEEHKASIQQTLTNLTQVLLVKNNMSTETHTLGIKDGRIVVYKK
ncbi:MAG: hypothetical protein KBC22_00505 [Candidatus Pacebacteria bacterium]|nr:hypothetical protein [Candidatus Paceibacterota bacterium]